MEDKLRSDAKDKSFSIEKRKRVPKERVPKFPLVEKGVYEWYRNMRDKRLVVKTDGLMGKALEIFAATKEE